MDETVATAEPPVNSGDRPSEQDCFPHFQQEVLGHLRHLTAGDR